MYYEFNEDFFKFGFMAKDAEPKEYCDLIESSNMDDIKKLPYAQKLRAMLYLVSEQRYFNTMTPEQRLSFRIRKGILSLLRQVRASIQSQEQEAEEFC